MDAAHQFDAKKHVRTYITVFTSLMALTAVTVGVSYLHLRTIPAVIVALSIATFKGSLVASYFMHLISEKKFIYLMLIFSGFLFVALMGLIIFGQSNYYFHQHVS
jgi:cytochrome c oxidase subunit IV